MEKVTFKPLIELLAADADSLNQMLRAFSAKQIDSRQIPLWFKKVIEPSFKEFYGHDKEAAFRSFPILYRFMLKALTANFATELAQETALLLMKNPVLTTARPERILNSLFVAVKKIAAQSRDAAEKWLNLMQSLIGIVKSEEELFAVGRLAAWRCGMAQFRPEKKSLEKFDERVLSTVFAGLSLEDLDKRWEKEMQPLASPGFIGFCGPFKWPPLVATDGNNVYAFDGQKIAVLFADRFGCVFHDCPAELKGKLRFGKAPKKKKSARLALLLESYVDLSSWVVLQDTLYLTLSSSHAVFVFGGIDG
jgi:hypothetical protein